MTRTALVRLLPLALTIAAGCDTNGPTMKPGENCLTCHNRGRNTWTVAGTVFSKPDDPTTAGVEGVDVLITDASGKSESLTSNSAGNFYTSTAFTFPLSAEFHYNGKVVKMSQPVTSGGCSGCHTQPPSSGAPGRNYAPQ